MKLSALQALALLPPSRRSREDVVSLLGHEEPAIRAAAMRVLARLDAADLALVLSGMGQDPVWSVRAALASGLAGAHDELSVGLLYGLLKDEDGRVVAAALEALGRSLESGAALTLVQHLGHADVGVRVAAASGLAAFHDTAHVQALLEAYRRSLGDADPEARLAIAKALAAVGEATPRIAAASARPAIDYALAMAPYDPRPGMPVYTPRAFVRTRRGAIEIRLNTVEAPLATDSFIALARRGYFEGLEFHRVVPGLRVEGGCPRGDGLGGPGYRLRREVGLRPFGRGAVGLDSSGKDTEGSRFFIALTPLPEQDAQSTLLGTVVSGMETVESLRQGDVIESVEVWD